MRSLGPSSCQSITFLSVRTKKREGDSLRRGSFSLNLQFSGFSVVDAGRELLLLDPQSKQKQQKNAASEEAHKQQLSFHVTHIDK